MRYRIETTLTLATMAVVMRGTACRKSETPQYGARGAETSAAVPAPAAAPGTTATAAPGQLTDANIVYILDQANAADSVRGALAEKEGTHPEVRRFGRLMMGEHHALRVEGQALAKRLNVTPQPPAGDMSEAQARQEMDTLNAI